MHQIGTIIRFTYKNNEHIVSVKVIHKVNGKISYDMYDGERNILFKNVPEEKIIVKKRSNTNE